MKKAILCMLLFCFVLPIFAAELEVKVDKETLKLPFWPAKEPFHGGLVVVKGGVPEGSEFLVHLAPRISSKGWSVLLLQTNPGVKTPWAAQMPAVLSAFQESFPKRTEPANMPKPKAPAPKTPDVPIVLLYYGEGLNQLEEYRAKAFDKKITGLILLSAYDEKANTLKLEELALPILDVTGQFDYDLALEAAKAREVESKSTVHEFLVLPGAYHDYHYAEDALTSFLMGWMKNIPILEPLPPGKGKPAAKTPQKRASYIEPIYSLESSFMALN